MYVYIYIYIYIYIYNHKVGTLHVFFIILYRVITMKKNYIFEKYFRLTSLSIHYIYISLKTVDKYRYRYIIYDIYIYIYIYIYIRLISALKTLLNCQNFEVLLNRLFYIHFWNTLILNKQLS